MSDVRSPKGTVSVENYRGRIRLRWRYLGIRYSLSLSEFNKINLPAAYRLGILIEYDMANQCFDDTLVRYGAKRPVEEEPAPTPKTTVEGFETWTKDFKQLDCDVNSDYHHLRNTLRKWGEIPPERMLTKLNSEKFCPKTYNERLSMLKNFSHWMVKQGVWSSNPFEGVSRRKVKKTQKPDRKPFTPEEIRRILDALKNDSFLPKCATTTHSHYHPFVYFIFKTGVRNAEAVGLRVSHVDLERNLVHIRESLARTVKGTNANARVRKETKNGKERFLPLTDDLKDVLSPLFVNKKPDDLVFLSPKGLSIDDRMFQRRVFKPVLRALASKKGCSMPPVTRLVVDASTRESPP